MLCSLSLHSYLIRISFLLYPIRINRINTVYWIVHWRARNSEWISRVCTLVFLRVYLFSFLCWFMSIIIFSYQFFLRRKSEHSTTLRYWCLRFWNFRFRSFLSFWCLIYWFTDIVIATEIDAYWFIPIISVLNTLFINVSSLTTECLFSSNIVPLPYWEFSSPSSPFLI